jgi:hypothetical protein
MSHRRIVLIRSLLVVVLLTAGLVAQAHAAQAQAHAGCAVWSQAENRCLQAAPTATELAACTVWSHAENRCLSPESPAAALTRITEEAHAIRDAGLERIRQAQVNATPIAPQLVTPANPPVTITQKCAKEWPTDFRMQAYCQKQQVEALGQLTTRGSMQQGAGATIRARCAKEWPNDFRMANYCEEQQLKALASLR